MKEISRCPWPGTDPLMIRYHDREWGTPVHRDRKMFEFLILESFQAGLSWRTVLHKRKNFQRAFAGFNYQQVAKCTPRDVARLMNDAGIIRNRQKIEAAINNARRFVDVRKEYHSFSRYLWNFVHDRPIQNRWQTSSQIPAVTPLAITIAADMKKRGFKFLGPTVIYAHLQAVGVVQDHLVSCFRHPAHRQR